MTHPPKNVLIASLFYPQSRTVAPPTMSVEEWGKIEIDRALERQNEVMNESDATLMLNNVVTHKSYF